MNPLEPPVFDEVANRIADVELSGPQDPLPILMLGRTVSLTQPVLSYGRPATPRSQPATDGDGMARLIFEPLSANVSPPLFTDS